MINYIELFEELNDIQKKYCFVKAWNAEVILTEDGFRFKDFTFDNFVQTIGLFNEEDILDAFINPENEALTADKQGLYEFKALLTYNPGETDEYGRYYARPYMNVEHYDWRFICSVEDWQEMQKQDSSDNLTQLF